MRESLEKRLERLEKLPFGSAPVGILLPSGDGFVLHHGTEVFYFKSEQEGIDFFHKRTANQTPEPLLIYWGRGTDDE